MYSYESFTDIQSPRLNLTRLGNNNLEEIVQSLFSPTTWVVSVRGINNKRKLYKYLENFFDKDAKGESLTLVVRVNSTNEVAGISRFHSAGPNFLRVEIGYTWIADRWQRTFVNTEKKLWMVRYAFEKIKVKRVEFSVDPKNEKSNSAMMRLGAKFEGTLRKWRFLNELDQGNRNIYSIIDDEWPVLQTQLECLLAKYR